MRYATVRCAAGRHSLRLRSDGAAPRCHHCVGAAVPHHERRTPEYVALAAAIRRCHDDRGPQWHRYGGRGIRVCDAWLAPGGYFDFIAHVGRRPSAAHSLDRIDPDGHYEPGNVRWADAPVQSANKSRAPSGRRAALTIRVTPDEREEIQRWAHSRGDVAAVLRRYLLAAARRAR